LQEPQQLQRLTLKAKITTKPEQQLANVTDKPAPSSGDASSSSSNSSSAMGAAAAAAAGVMPFKQLTVRPVMLKGKLLLQMSLLDSRQVRMCMRSSLGYASAPGKIT
jgi:hypothetical protein